MKSFQNGKLLGKYWRVLLDGTDLFYFRENHRENCLVKTVEQEDGSKRKTYYHKVLKAKLVLLEKIIISLDTEFIENKKETVSKQDCELRTAERLLGRLKKDYPCLLVCIQGDSLYETQPLMVLCRENG